MGEEAWASDSGLVKVLKEEGGIRCVLSESRGDVEKATK